MEEMFVDRSRCINVNNRLFIWLFKVYCERINRKEGKKERKKVNIAKRFNRLSMARTTGYPFPMLVPDLSWAHVIRWLRHGCGNIRIKRMGRDSLRLIFIFFVHRVSLGSGVMAMYARVRFTRTGNVSGIF